MTKFVPIDLAPRLAGDSDAPSARLDVKMFRVADDPITEAQTDAEIAREFIGNGELSAKSIANSQKELFRFLTWCREEAKKTLSQLNVADLNAYKEFLRNPPPDWVSTTKWPRSDPRYRPFTGPLSDPSRRQAMIAVKGLLSFAEQTGYLRRNPAALVRNVRTPIASRITRYLTPEAIALAVETVSQRVPDSPAALRRRERDRFLLVAFAHTGARLNELVSANMGAIYAEGNDRWWLDVIGKGNKPRRLPVPEEMLDAYRRYREAFGLPPHTARADRMPLVLSSRSKAVTRLTDEAASEAIKGVFAEAASAAARAGQADIAASLRHASAHWLRHSMLTNHANNGVQLKTLQDTAGHANIATTAGYLHKTDNERHDEIIASNAARKGKGTD
ncbi:MULTISPECIES: tyrosine-type recombinase/integrase [unclassified Massilia]|uniref:tyrosine-type recombinase/integrase n=1 Tax=unclassified Massilia TaxID=2609279 RepID=UPI0017848102|nr:MULTISPECIES: tyrosine-type recombinase/integrase [unclassified Massilia]MBD8528486.1 tyrosine-type recombinase/integrase [Massilia sp. CFBP 13647]MBD8671891.1 tyrosine-type recombinase/integrase [Massilia sp. CFBP 13721]